MLSSRRIVRGGLLAAGGLALSVVILPLAQMGPRKAETWATIAAALAVLTAVVSAWTSQRVLELQEDAHEPSIVLSLDARRRPQLVQFRVANVGGSLARNVEIHWDEPLLNVKREPVRISSLAKGADVIPVLAPGHSTAVLVDVAYRFFEIYSNTTYSGTVRYKNASGISRSTRFLVSAEVYRQSLRHEDEEAITHEKLQDIPGQLKEIAAEIAGLRQALKPPEVELEAEEDGPDMPPNPAPAASA